MKASDLFVKCLEEEGVEYIFGIPGEENLDLLESIRKSKIKLIVTRHEQAAAFMAATYGRLTGKAGVALSTLGPGATNLVTGVAFAQLGGMPLVVLTGQKPIKKSKQGQFQIVDIVEMMMPITKSARQIHSGEYIPSMVRNAFKLAEEERPGATLLEFPEDIAREEVKAKPIPRMKIRRPGPDPKAVEMAVEIIEKSKSPLILIAAGANRKLIHLWLEKFLEKTKIPFVTTQMGKGIDERSPQYVGTAALSEGDFVHCAIEKADVLLVIGHDIFEKPPFLFNSNSSKKIIHINFYPATIDDIYNPTLEVIGEISHTIWTLMEKVSPQAHWDFNFFEKTKKTLQEHIHRKSTDNSFPIIPERFVTDLRKVLGTEDILTLDNGMFKLWISRNYQVHRQNRLILDNALATMGAGLPSAIAAKMVKPYRKVVAVCGDGGFMMNSQELETAIRLKLDLIVLILNDSGYGMIKWKQDSMKLPSFGLDFNNPDFVEYAKSYGAKGHRINSTEEFVPTIKKLMSEKGVHVVDVPIDYSDNVKVFTEELENDVCKLIKS